MSGGLCLLVLLVHEICAIVENDQMMVVAIVENYQMMVVAIVEI